MSNKRKSFDVSMSGMPGMGALVTEVKADLDFSKIKREPDNMPVLPLRDMVVFPGLPIPVSIGRESSLLLVKEAAAEMEAIMVVAQKDSSVDNPGARDLYRIGTVCQVLKVIEVPDGSVTAFLLPVERARLLKINSRSPYLRGKTESEPETDIIDVQNPVYEALVTNLVNQYRELLHFLGENEMKEVSFNLEQVSDHTERKVNYMIMNSPLATEEKQKLMEASTWHTRIEMLLRFLDLARQKMEIRAEIQMRTHEDMTRQQKEVFLQTQMRAIQDELGAASDDNEITELAERADKKKWSDDARKHFDKELAKLQRLNVQNPEYQVQYAYLDTLLNLPWNNYSEDNISLQKVEEILDRDHFGMEKVKERILDHIAVLKLRNDLKAPIICLYGPPGVGKTSLGKSIAEALGKEYARISLGGLHDEAEIRGHRRTYIGALPGRIISALAKCGTGNPVFVLDEIDKIGKDMKGDPSTALLEVLDPEQNSKFHDNYVDFDYDLSRILFIATANSLSTISRPLLDRMEIIELSGYTTGEKVNIAQRHLLPRILVEHGFSSDELSFTDESMEYIVDHYTRESGVRSLEKKVARIIRKLARKKVAGEDLKTLIEKDDAVALLGKEEVFPDIYENNDFAGVVTGLAWTQVGGEILFIETSLSRGKGEKLTLTGNLGDVMKESAVIALQYLKANAGKFGLDPEEMAKYDVHIHVPEGAIPKDGPSAGITMVTSLASAFTRRKVRERVAMTGEITLRGKVLPVGGVKEKILAAKRAGITDIILSSRNRKDIEEIEDRYLTGLTFHYVDLIEEVLDFALLNDIAPL